MTSSCTWMVSKQMIESDQIPPKWLVWTHRYLIQRTVYQLITPSAAYMRQRTGLSLVQVMSCRLVAPSHFLNQCWGVVNWTLGNKLKWNLNQNSCITVQENAFENVLKMAAILSRPQCVNTCGNMGYNFRCYEISVNRSRGAYITNHKCKHF